MKALQAWFRVGVALCAWTTAAAAQYRRDGGDTLRLREVSTGVMSLEAPTGVVEIHTEHDAIIAVAFSRADSARAWYESLKIALVAPDGRHAPETSDALRKPFVISFDSRGRVRTLQTPEFPATFEGISDLSHQFDDLFLRLPAKPLNMGVTWEDTVSTGTDGPAGKQFRSARQIRARVVRDTVVAGEPGWVIETVQQQSLESSEPMEGQPLTVRTKMAGTDSGVFVFSRAGGRMLGRARTGSMTGALTYEGGPSPVVLPLAMRYVNTVTVKP